MNNDSPSPLKYLGVMISSTFTDLKDHRAALIKAIKSQELTDIGMENDAARADLDVIDSSLQMVRDGSAYIGVVSRKYGQTPNCPRRNPDSLSITELEFNEAQRLGRPILLFIMGENYSPLKEADVELDPEKRQKLNAFRERAKTMGPDSEVHRVYSTFETPEQFAVEATKSVAKLRRYLDRYLVAAPPEPEELIKNEPKVIPRPPAFYAEPPYIGSHEFLGRKEELERLNEWASTADSHPILLFEAIGGTGKSLLTWEWSNDHALGVRDDWAGRFWYSFYERGAVMADFCRRALAYITGYPLKAFQKLKTVQLGEMLIGQLQERPWLLVLDGLERVLVAYHRIDAAQVLDEEAGSSDQIAHRDPCAAIRPEDDDLLRALTTAVPSKLILTSRLIPRVLLNQSSQPIPGVLRIPLPGLRPADAEDLLRSCAVNGNSQEIQQYLKSHCDCHPLVIGVLAGLIKEYLPDRGNFDAWAADPEYGGRLNLANLNLIQKRNHILHAAMDALSEKSRQLLSTMAILAEAIDYPTLSALNPHLPPEPEEVEEPEKPEASFRWSYSSDAEKKRLRKQYEIELERRQEYEDAIASRLQSPEFLAAPSELANTVRDLERRGLLQYDAQTKHHDLHPVVRGVAAGNLGKQEIDQYGQRVVDYFSARSHLPYDQAETLEDLSSSLSVVRMLLKMGRHSDAADAYIGDLARALDVNLEAHVERLAVLRQFFGKDWLPVYGDMTETSIAYLAYHAGHALYSLGEATEGTTLLNTALSVYLQRRNWFAVTSCLYSIANLVNTQNRLAQRERCLLRALDIAVLENNNGDIFMARLHRFDQLGKIGQFADAEVQWKLLDPMGRNWERNEHVPGTAEGTYAWFRFIQGTLTQDVLAHAEALAKSGRNRRMVRRLHGIRGKWYLEKEQYALAAECFQEAIRMGREVGLSEHTWEGLLALANFRLGQLNNPRYEAEQLSSRENGEPQALAEIWYAIGDKNEARKHALKAYEKAWADGEPYVWRYELNQARALLEKLGAEIPNLPPYDPRKDEKFPWEDELDAAIAELRAEKEKEQNKKKE